MSDRIAVTLLEEWRAINAGETVFVDQKMANRLTSGPSPKAKPASPEEAEDDEPESEDDGPDADQAGKDSLDDMDTDFLRNIAEKEGIQSWHLMGHDRLVEELKDAGYDADSIS